MESNLLSSSGLRRNLSPGGWSKVSGSILKGIDDSKCCHMAWKDSPELEFLPCGLRGV